MTIRCIAIAAAGFLSAAALAAAEPNLLEDPGFENGSDVWHSMGPLRHRSIEGCGKQSSRGLRYQKIEDVPGENSHFDQIVNVEPNTWYVAGAWFKAQDGLEPMVRIADLEWQDVAIAQDSSPADWHLVETLFNSENNRQLRFQIFGGVRGRRREALAGTSFCDDAFFRQASDEDQRRFHHAKVVVDFQKVLRPLDPQFYGANALFMVEDDEALADGRIASLLREMPCRLLRYPGGDMADNYLWKTHSLDDPKHWPGIQGPQTTDTDEFMAFCRTVEAEPIFVVNLESGFVHGNLDAAAQYAADWVEYCNRKHDYRVRYWEIGNETYLYSPGKHKRYRVTAEEYGRAFLKFAAAMKAVDPAIRLGAIGPMEPDSVRNVEGDEPPRPWWPTVLEVAGPKIDFAVVHQYYGGQSLDLRQFVGNPLPVGQTVAELDEFFQSSLNGRRLPIALTEWNIGRRCPLKGMSAGLAIAELAIRYQTGGVDMSTFWPLENPGSQSTFRELINPRTHEPQIAYHVLQLLAQNTRQQLVESASSRAEIALLSSISEDGRAMSVVLLNKSLYDEGMTVSMDLGDLGTQPVVAHVLTAPQPESGEVSLDPLPLERRESGLSLRLPPISITVVTVNGE